MTLANVVVNEAGTSNMSAKVAVAYAWLNRTGGVVRAPIGAEISGYTDIQARWNGLDVAGRLTFLQQFPDALSAANHRLQAPAPADSDPTGGATHWVSPIGLPRYNATRYGGTRYSRTIGGAANRAFPLWARNPATDAAEVLRMQKAGQLDADYAEITVSGLPAEQFLFYRGVR